MSSNRSLSWDRFRPYDIRRANPRWRHSSAQNSFARSSLIGLAPSLGRFVPRRRGGQLRSQLGKSSLQPSDLAPVQVNRAVLAGDRQPLEPDDDLALARELLFEPGDFVFKRTHCFVDLE